MSEMISVAEGFQYSVNIAYDLHADDKLKSYIPTQSALQLMEDILQSTLPTATDRSRVLIGAYGKGKSHIVLTILALLMKRDLDLFEKLLPAIQKRDKLNRLIQNYYASDNKLLPVIITGSNTSLTQAFLLALQQTLKENDLLNIMPDTNYKAAVSVIERWKNDFPDTYQQFKNKIADSISSFISRLEDYDIKAYEEFERIYPSLTAGSTFNPFVGFDVVQLYESVVQALKPHGYTGIYVIYDEFSKYLEANISEASVSDTKMLQDFAEKCNRSGKNQMHLMLISHKEIANYIDRLPKQKVDGWRGVSERFTHIHLNNNFTQTYEIIATVIQKNQKLWNLFCAEHKKEFNALARRYETHRIFSDMQSDSVEHTIAACYPLHPVSTFMVFIRTGMREWYEKNMESTIEKMDNALDRLLNLSYIHSSIDAIYDDRDLQGVEKTFGYFTLYGRYLKENHFVRMGTVLEKEAIYDDDFNVRSFNQANAEAKMIINVIRHYRKTYGKNTDCLTLAFINPSDLQVVVSAITGYVASVKKLDIPIYIIATIILPEKNKGGRNYLSYWLDNLVDADAGVHIESYLEYWDEYKDIHNKIRSNTDIAFFMDVLQEPGQTFLGYQTADWPTTMKPLECRYPMVFKPNIDYVSNISRSVDISQPQFPAATAHTQALLYAAHPDITKINKIYRRDKMNDALRAEIRSAHNQAIWVVCVDEAIDKECIRGICKGEEYPEEYPVIGFSTGDGSYGQLNLTITTRQTVKTDIQQRCKRRLKSIFYTWDDASLNTASQTCIDRAPRLDGVSVLLALNPNAYEINNFLAYLMLDKIYEDTGKNYCLIHLDSYRHWFDAKNPDEEQKIPDFLVVAVDSDAAGKTVLHATVAECKIAKCIHKDEHIQKAKSQVENGISVLKAHFSPDSKSIERRYWYAQLYRALAFTKTDSRTSKLLDAIIDGEFDIDWSGEIYGFWFDSDDEQDTMYTDYSGAQDIIVHNICQKTIQRVLLKKTPSEEVEFIREIGALEQEDEPANEEFDALDDDFSETVHEDDAITMPDTQEDMDTPPNLPEILEEDKKSVAVLVSPKTEETIQPEILVEPDAEIALTSETADLDKTSPVEETPLEDVRLLIGKEKRGTDVFWEFGHPKLSNRHLLITGTSGQGKTYCIQTLLLELARQGISSVIFDYTDGFLPNKLEPEFQEALGEKIEQKVAVVNRIPVNPFVLQSVEIPSIGSVSEKASDVAGRISDILTHVYGFGDQQRAAIYKACKEGIDRYGAQMSFARLQELLEESKIKEAKTVSSKMMQFFDNDLFDTSNSFDWKDILNNDGKVTVIQLTNLDRTLQTIITEITLWDAWYSLTKFGNKDTPFVVVLDEAQNLSFKSGSPAEKILREGRKYGWSAWFATQFLKGALDSGEISNLQQAAERLYFKPSGEEMNYIAGQIASERTEIQDWYNRLKNMQKGQCIVQGDRIKPNGEFGSIQPALVNVTSFGERK